MEKLCQIPFYDYPKSSATETLNRPFNPSSLFVKQRGGQALNPAFFPRQLSCRQE